MTIDIYKISNPKIINFILPFYARGRRMSLFLEAVASPLVSIHKAFLEWGYDMILKTKITSQTDVLIWYLNYKFNRHFNNPSDSFAIEQEIEIDNLTAFNYREIALFKMVGVKIFDGDEAEQEYDISKPTRDFNRRNQTNAIIIRAPKLKADANYTDVDYKTDIIAIINDFKTSFRKYAIEINEN